MQKLGLVVLMMCALALTAGAQTKTSGKAQCAKPDNNYSLDVGDKPGHTLSLTKVNCTYDTPMEIAGSKLKESVNVATAEMTGASVSERGYHMGTMDNGDKLTTRYQANAKMNKDGTGSFEGKWSFTSGTGKLKGIKGGGTYKGTVAADGTSQVDVEGEYTVPEAKPAPAKK